MCEHISMSENNVGVIESIATIEEFPWEERGHGHFHNITCFVLDEEQGKDKICHFYRIGIKHKTVICVKSKTTTMRNNM